VSATTQAVAAGAGLLFEERGTRELKGFQARASSIPQPATATTRNDARAAGSGSPFRVALVRARSGTVTPPVAVGTAVPSPTAMAPDLAFAYLAIGSSLVGVAGQPQ
jgi:hypothetical protein